MRWRAACGPGYPGTDGHAVFDRHLDVVAAEHIAVLETEDGYSDFVIQVECRVDQFSRELVGIERSDLPGRPSIIVEVEEALRSVPHETLQSLDDVSVVRHGFRRWFSVAHVRAAK